MSVRDYLFLDSKRLDSYVSQIGSPVTYDKVPVWDMELSIKGPKVGGTQSRSSRPHSDSEKIRLLIKHLRDHNELSYRRPHKPGSCHTDPIFHVETCRACRVVLPPKEGVVSNFPGLALWYSKAMQPEDDTSEYWSNTPLRSSLFLLEDYANKDNENPGFVSAYSSLLLLMNAAFQQIQLTSVAFDLAAINEKDFLRDPVTALRRLGALPGREREISALYKVLNSTVQGHAAKRKTEDSEMITVGYAIAICEGKTDFDKR